MQGLGRGERELVGEHFRRGGAAAGQAGIQIVEPHGECILDNGMGDRRLADAEGIGKGPVEMLGHLQGGVECLDQEGPGLGFDDVIDRPFPVQALRQQPVEIGFGILAQTFEGKADGPVADVFHPDGIAIECKRTIWAGKVSGQADMVFRGPVKDAEQASQKAEASEWVLSHLQEIAPDGVTWEELCKQAGGWGERTLREARNHLRGQKVIASAKEGGQFGDKGSKWLWRWVDPDANI